LQGLKKRWQGRETWFIAGTEATSQAERVARSLARSGIRESRRRRPKSTVQQRGDGSSSITGGWRRRCRVVPTTGRFIGCGDPRSQICLGPRRHFIVLQMKNARPSETQEPVDASRHA